MTKRLLIKPIDNIKKKDETSGMPRFLERGGYESIDFKFGRKFDNFWVHSTSSETLNSEKYPSKNLRFNFKKKTIFFIVLKNESIKKCLK